jgi:hypothetical protein
MRTKEMSAYKPCSIGGLFLGHVRGILTSVAVLMVAGVGTPAGAQQEPFGTVAGTPAQVANLRVDAFEVGQFGDVAFLCPPGGCRNADGNSIVRLDESVWADVSVDTGDQFPDELNATVHHTFAGYIIGVLRQGEEAPPSATADIVCFSLPNTPAGQENRCVKIVEDSEGGEPDLTPLVVTKDDSSLCEDLASGIVGTPPPVIAYVVQLSTVPPPSGPSILVCEGYNWVGVEPGDFGEFDVAVTGQQQLDVVKTPAIVTCDGIRCRR